MQSIYISETLRFPEQDHITLIFTPTMEVWQCWSYMYGVYCKSNIPHTCMCFTSPNFLSNHPKNTCNIDKNNFKFIDVDIVWLLQASHLSDKSIFYATSIQGSVFTFKDSIGLSPAMAPHHSPLWLPWMHRLRRCNGSQGHPSQKA